MVTLPGHRNTLNNHNNKMQHRYIVVCSYLLFYIYRCCISTLTNHNSITPVWFKDIQFKPIEISTSSCRSHLLALLAARDSTNFSIRTKDWGTSLQKNDSIRVQSSGVGQKGVKNWRFEDFEDHTTDIYICIQK